MQYQVFYQKDLKHIQIQAQGQGYGFRELSFVASGYAFVCMTPSLYVHYHTFMLCYQCEQTRFQSADFRTGSEHIHSADIISRTKLTSVI